MSPLLNDFQLISTSVARTLRRPLTCSTRFTSLTFVQACLKPEATPPF